MRICIPTEDDLGLDATLAGHFGRAPFFTLVDGAAGTANVIRNDEAEHGHGHCDAPRLIAGAGAGAVICRGLGRGALMRLRDAGIEVFVTDAADVRSALQSFEASSIEAASLDDACAGGHHGGECGSPARDA